MEDDKHYLNSLDEVEFVFDHGANVNKSNEQGVTGLMLSVSNTDLCRVLLKGGAEINAYDKRFCTALHYAIRSNQRQSVQLLLANGADPFFQCENGNDALSTACLYRTTKIFDTLRCHVNYSPERLANALELMGAVSVLSDIFNHLRFRAHLSRKEDEDLLHPHFLYADDDDDNDDDNNNDDIDDDDDQEQQQQQVPVYDYQYDGVGEKSENENKPNVNVNVNAKKKDKKKIMMLTRTVAAV